MPAMIERVAAAIANRRAGRRGAPAVSNVLDLLKAISGGKLYEEVIDDARAVIEAMREPTDSMTILGAHASLSDLPALTVWQAMIDAALKE